MSEPFESAGEPVAWQRRYMYALPTDPAGKVYQWEPCSKQEATGHFDKQPGYEYRALYVNPPASPTSEVVEALTALHTAYCDVECNGDRGLHDAVCIRATAALATVQP